MLISDLYETATVADRAGRLPLLAHVLQATWVRRSGNRMTLAGYRATGGIARAVADTAETAWSAVDPDDQNLARTLLVALVHVGPANMALRVPLAVSTITDRFPARVSTIIDIFARARLLTVTADSVMLVHDVVLTSWPRLAELIAVDAGTHQWRQHLDTDTAAWLADGRGRSFLYTGSRLDDALRRRVTLQRSYQHLLSADNDAFLDAAVAQKRRRRILTVASIVVVALLAIASTITAGIALRQTHALTAERNDAERSALLAHIDSVQKTHPSLAARLLLTAHRLYPDDRTVADRLRGAAATPLVTPVTGHSGPVYDMAFDHDGRLFASAGGDRTVRIWETGPQGLQPAGVITGFGNYVTSVSFHPSRPLLATGSGDGTLRLWDLHDPDAPRQLTSVTPGHGTVYLVRFAPDGRTLAAATDDGSITVYSIPAEGDPVQTAVLRGHGAAARALAFSPDGRLMASGGDDRTVRLWTTGPQPRAVGAPLTGFPNITHGLAFSPDSRLLAITGDSANAQLWDVADPTSPTAVNASLPDTTAGSWSIAFGPTGHQLASARADGSLAIWNTIDPDTAATQWVLQAASEQGTVRAFSTVYSPDGKRVFSGRSDGTIEVWRLPDIVYPDRGGTITGLASNADSHLLATVGTDTTLNLWTSDGDALTLRSRTRIQRRVNDHPEVALNAGGSVAATANNNGGTIELWDVADPSRPRPAARLTVATRYSNPVAFAPRGGMLATADTDHTVALWNTDDPHRPTRIGDDLAGPTDLIRSITFSPDGTRLAVSADDNRVYVYDLRTPGSEPRTVVDVGAPATSVAFLADDVIAAAAKDLTTWRLTEAGPAEELDRVHDMYASSLSRTPHRLIVGTATRVLVSLAVGADGKFSDAQTITPLLPSTVTTMTWQFPGRSPSDRRLVAGGDTTGSLYAYSLGLDAARTWICANTPPLTTAQRAASLPRTEIPEVCG